jgi:hypothetical protein
VAFCITAGGNGYTSSERVPDFLLLRAAEIVILRGCKGFIITVVAHRSPRINSRRRGSDDEYRGFTRRRQEHNRLQPADRSDLVQGRRVTAAS